MTKQQAQQATEVDTQQTHLQHMRRGPEVMKQSQLVVQEQANVSLPEINCTAQHVAQLLVVAPDSLSQTAGCIPVDAICLPFGLCLLLPIDSSLMGRCLPIKLCLLLPIDSSVTTMGGLLVWV